MVRPDGFESTDIRFPNVDGGEIVARMSEAKSGDSWQKPLVGEPFRETQQLTPGKLGLVKHSTRLPATDFMNAGRSE